MDPEQLLKRRIDLLLQLTQGITIQELEAMPPFGLAIKWRDRYRDAHQLDELRNALQTIADGITGIAAATPAGVIDAYRQLARQTIQNYYAEMDAVAASHHPQDSVTIVLTPTARQTVEAIGRTGESDEATIVRILDTLAASSPDFDHFYGAPRDGRGPSGE
jgi:hypothetical protein